MNSVDNATTAGPIGKGSIAPPPIDGLQALRAGLDLARASQLTMVRFQLALQKSDRRIAMQALDDLLDLDAEMESLAATPVSVPSGPIDGAPLSAFIRHQRSAIAVEKHGLTGSDGRSVAKPRTAAVPDDRADRERLADPQPAGDAAEESGPAITDDVAPPLPPAEAVAGGDRAPTRPWLLGLAITIGIALVGLGLVAWLWPEWLAPMLRIPSEIMGLASSKAG